jgi:hypothetical protein
MTADEKRTIAAMMRRFLMLMADRRALISILDTAVEMHSIPNGWKDDLERLRQTPEYRKILAEYEPTILQLEQAPEFDDLIPILEKMNKGKLPN